MSDASTSLYKKNGGFNYERSSWKEYPAVGDTWRKNCDKSGIGEAGDEVCSECGGVIKGGRGSVFDGKAYRHRRCP